MLPICWWQQTISSNCFQLNIWNLQRICGDPWSGWSSTSPPTSEFWDWQTFEEPFDNQTHLRVKFIGLGWLIALTRRFYSTDQVSPISVERDLSQILSKITGHVPVHAVARLKSTPWSVDNLKVLAKTLRSTYPDMKINRKTKMLTAPDIQVLFEAQERVRLSRISSELDGQVHQILGISRDGLILIISTKVRTGVPIKDVDSQRLLKEFLHRDSILTKVTLPLQMSLPGFTKESISTALTI